MGAYCLIHLQARRDSHQVTGQPKDLRSASTPAHITRDLTYCHFSRGLQCHSALLIQEEKYRCARILSVHASTGPYLPMFAYSTA